MLWLLQSLCERDISNKEVESGIGFLFLFLFVFFLFGLICEKHVELCSFCLLKTWFALLLLLLFSFLDFVLWKVEFLFLFFKYRRNFLIYGSEVLLAFVIWGCVGL